MDRRGLLAACAATAGALAGCGGTDTTGAGGDDAGTTAAGETDAAAGPTVVGVDAPGETPLGRPHEFEVTLRNPTDGRATVSSGVSVAAGEDWRRATTLSAELPAGARRTVPASVGLPPYLGRYRVRLDAFDRSWTVRTTPRRLAFGTAFRAPTGLAVAVQGGRFTDAYAATANATVTPESDGRFLVVRVRLRNPTGAAVESPPLGAFRVRAGESDYRVRLSDPDQRLTVAAGVRKGVELPFVVPRSVAGADVQVWWAPAYEAGRQAVYWTGD